MSEERDLLERALKQMKLINGPDEKCVIGEWKVCENHRLIHDIEALLERSTESPR